MINTGKSAIGNLAIIAIYLLMANCMFGQVTDYPLASGSAKSASLDLSGLPDFKVTDTEATIPGYYVFEISPYLIIIDHYGNPLFYRSIPFGVRNFKPQPDGKFSYYSISDRRFYIMNSFYQVTDTFEVLGGFYTDFHEFRLLSNGNSLMVAVDARLVDMSQVVEGGNPNATVMGLVFQELDKDRNLLFEWSSWDHFDILDCDTNLVDLTSQVIDLIHGNSISIDFDGHLILSSRHLSEITKIDRTNGEIIWRLGGKNNEFTFLDDPIGFSGQHTAIRMPFGYLGLFDNGLNRLPQYSRGIIYQMNELEKTVSMVKEFRHSPDVYSPEMGNFALMPGNHVLIGWGKNSANAFLTEFDQNGNICTSISIPGTTIYSSYHISFIEQLQSVISTNENTIDFGYVETGDSAIQFIELLNEGSDPATLFAFSDEAGQFGIVDTLPVEIAGGATEQVGLKFKPTEAGNYDTPMYLKFRLDSTIKDDHMIACRLMLRGTTTAVSSTGKYQIGKGLQVYPNPFYDRIIVEHSSDVTGVVIWSMTGEKVFQVQCDNRERLVLDQIHLDPGFYLIELLFRDDTREFMKIVKGR